MSGIDVSVLWFLALLLAAAGGYVAARLTAKPRNTTTRSIDQDYFAGLNFLLNEEPDRALEVFLRMTQVDDETVETHFALGSLYRRRGEVDRAIRVHENVLARSDLQPEHREHAMFALGEDYFRAGVFDRAERLFEDVPETSTRHVAALRYLLRIHEQQREWQEAVATHERLAKVAAPEHPTAVAHYHCELAEIASAQGRLDEARELLRKARAQQRMFPRGALLRARLALAAGDPSLAAKLCRRAVEFHPHLLPITLPALVESLRAQGQQEGEAGLREFVRTGPARRAHIAYAAIVTGLQHEPILLDCVRDLLKEDSNLSDLVPALAGGHIDRPDADLEALARALARVFRRTQQYRCVDCGFSTARHFWQCPGCRGWDTLAPVASVELAPMARRR